jgi:hypothetical protein
MNSQRLASALQASRTVFGGRDIDRWRQALAPYLERLTARKINAMFQPGPER